MLNKINWIIQNNKQKTVYSSIPRARQNNFNLKHKMSVKNFGLVFGSFLAVFTLAFIGTALWSHFVTPVKDSEALIDGGNYSVSVSSSEALNINLKSTYEGAIGSVKDTVVTKTNAPSGYRLFLSTNATGQEGNRLKHNDYASHSTDKRYYFAPSKGNISTPKALGQNQWGFAVGNGTAGLVGNGFDTNYNVISNTSKFAAIPAKGEEVLIQATSSANEAGVSLDVYYAMKANTEMTVGTYNSTLVYTALIDATNQTTPEATITPAEGPAAGNTSVTIKTSLKGNLSDSELLGFIGTINTTIDNKPCTSPSYSVENGTLKITCNTPAGTGGAKTVSVSIPKVGKTYTIANGFTYQQQDTFNGITTMQQMTTSICENETTPHAFVGNNSSNPILSATTRTHTADKNFIPEAELTDTRDNRKYVIRKLADGNCWMVQNLDLGDTAVSLTPENTDLNGVPGFTLGSAETNASPSWGAWNNSSDVNRIRLHNDGNKWLINVSLGTQEIVTSNEPSGPELKIRHIGNYYNWYTATAKTGTYEMTSNQEASSSICPKGWRLPSNTGPKSYLNLTQAIYRLTIYSGDSDGQPSSLKLRSKPFSFPLSGSRYRSGSVHYQDSYGWFWSSTAYSDTGSYTLDLHYTGLHPQDNNFEAEGFSIRCLVR